MDPRAQPAVEAYLKSVAAVNNAERTPRKLGDPIDPAADYGRYTFDPANGQQDTYILYLSQNGWALRGTPPTPRPVVSSVDLSATPYPTVMLTDCPTSAARWELYDVKTGKTVPDPYATRTPLTLSIQVIYYAAHWGVYKVDHLAGRPCTD